MQDNGEDLCTDNGTNEDKKRISVSMKFIILYSVSVVLIFTITFLTLRMMSSKKSENMKAELGVEAVKCMYDFGTIEQLDENMAGLQAITTDEVFSQLTIDREERTLYTYLKFKNKPVTVNVLKSTASYVLYNLETENISENRIFMFMFDVNSSGKISYVREVECIDFIYTSAQSN